MVAHLTLTDDLADVIAEAVGRGTPVEVVAQRVGVARGTIQQWLASAESGTWQHGEPLRPDAQRIITAFADKVRRARAAHFEQMVASIQQCATTPNEKTGMPDWRAADTMLSKHPAYRSMWREERRTTVEQTGTVRHEHTLARQLEPEALEAAYQALEALPDGSENTQFSDP